MDGIYPLTVTLTEKEAIRRNTEEINEIKTLILSAIKDRYSCFGTQKEGLYDGQWDGYFDTAKFGPKFDLTKDY